MKKIVVMFAGCWLCFEAEAQNKKPSRFEYYFNGAVGAYYPTKGPKESDYNGNMFSFQLQINYKDRFFTRPFIDSYDIGYKSELVTQGITLAFNDRVQTLNLGGDFGYAWQIGRFSPYAYTGLGLALVNLPQITTTTSSRVQIDKPSIQTFAFRTGGGLDFEVTKNFILYLELQYLSIPDTNSLQQQPLNGISLQVGIKTPL
ncbi:MAG: outer membrane beta-barrel protein [Cytophagales bacterium]